MSLERVTKRFDLQGRDERDLERRLDTLRQAIRAQNGAILDVKWTRPKALGPHTASVVYFIPLMMMTA